VLEELLFRGLVLRGLMLRLALLAARAGVVACFGLFHAQSLGRDSVAIVAATPCRHRPVRAARAAPGRLGRASACTRCATRRDPVRRQRPPA
jgi:hypothetical protein